MLISLLWPLAHTQYDWLGIAEIFVVLLGLARWSTGSTTITIILHMLSNLGGWIETEFVLGLVVDPPASPSAPLGRQSAKGRSSAQGFRRDGRGLSRFSDHSDAVPGHPAGSVG